MPWLFNRKKDTITEPAKTHVVEVGKTNSIPKDVVEVSTLKRRKVYQEQNELPAKRGMWVRYNDRTGILTNLERGDVATVMMVDENLGTNVIEIHVPANTLRQAHYEEIPESRRPSLDLAIKFGYIRK